MARRESRKRESETVTEEQNRQNAIGLLEREWQTVDTWLRSLDERQLDKPVFSEGPGWRVRDMVTHMASVQESCGRVAEKVAKEGVEPTTNWRAFLGIEKTNDELNAETFETWRERPMAERWDRWLRAHARMMDAVQALRPDQLLQAEDGEEGMKRHFALLGVIHLRIHREHIEAALKPTPSP
jgi:hypothetical protein